MSSLVFAKRFSHFLLQSETVRWICGKVVLIVRVMSSQALFLSWVETPVLDFPLIIFFFSCTNWARRRHSWSVQLGLLFLLDVLSVSSRDICLQEKHIWSESFVYTFVFGHKYVIKIHTITAIKFSRNKWHAQEEKTFHFPLKPKLLWLRGFQN